MMHVAIVGVLALGIRALSNWRDLIWNEVLYFCPVYENVNAVPVQGSSQL
jgi:hypothetical protein